MQSMEATKELILTCFNGVKGSIDTTETDTLATLRDKIHEELDDDLIPIPGFGFHVNDIRVSLKQETKKRTWDLIASKVNVSLQTKKPRPSSSLAITTTTATTAGGDGTTRTSRPHEHLEHAMVEQPAAKRIKIDIGQGPGYITPVRALVPAPVPIVPITEKATGMSTRIIQIKMNDALEHKKMLSTTSRTPKEYIPVPDKEDDTKDLREASNIHQAEITKKDAPRDLREPSKIYQSEVSKEEAPRDSREPFISHQTEVSNDSSHNNPEQETVRTKSTQIDKRIPKDTGLSGNVEEIANDCTETKAPNGIKLTKITQIDNSTTKDTGLSGNAEELTNDYTETTVPDGTEFKSSQEAEHANTHSDHEPQGNDMEGDDGNFSFPTDNQMEVDDGDYLTPMEEENDPMSSFEEDNNLQQSETSPQNHSQEQNQNVSEASDQSHSFISQDKDKEETGKSNLPIPEQESDLRMDVSELVTDNSGGTMQDRAKDKEDAPLGGADENKHQKQSSSRVDKKSSTVQNGDGNQDVSVVQVDHNEEEVIATEMPLVTNPNQESDEALESCQSVLRSAKKMLDENPSFCSENRRGEWCKDINAILENSSPNTIIGVLGNTGVGKSSLLNAVLDEAAVLPTSGSRGCTAAVVELRFNSDLLTSSADGKEVNVYKGEVEFMTMQEWQSELKILLSECSTEENYVYAKEPDPQSQNEAASAWAKIDQVYGQGTMSKYKRKSSDDVFRILVNNWRVRNLLNPSSNEHPYNIIPVEEGKILPGSQNANALMGNFHKMNVKMRRLKKRWANSFRSKINSYVYRKGNGNEAQTWPLIRKVVLHGPWSVLSSGACMVDLPGVRDANAARAKVSEHYLQHCNNIWIVAPIKRAVDDGTAKELLGEQFKRRLLMDGQYGNVSFICTQTDDCEATEIMRDHADVAQSVPGRWEQMLELSKKISDVEMEVSALSENEDDLQLKVDDAKNAMDDFSDQDDDETIDNSVLIEYENAVNELNDWKERNSSRIEELQISCEVKQRKLKTLCAIVRNEYSKGCLQADFRDGLKDLYRDEDGDDLGTDVEQPRVALPEDFQMDVYCISANDYLKGQGIKNKSDGAPNTFSKAEDTQIPDLRMFVHETTARQNVSFTKNFLNDASDVLDRIKLLAIDSGKVPSGRNSLCYMKLFGKEVNVLDERIQPLAKNLKTQLESKIQVRLQPTLMKGAKSAILSAIPICTSWGSKSRRNSNVRDKHHNGLYWSTYNATVKRSGVYTSGSAGAIDMNQELCDPMEKEFSTDWQRIMDSAIRTHLSECETQVQSICTLVNKAIACEFAKEGLNQSQLMNMSNTASRSCASAVKRAFDTMRLAAAETQRNLNRSLLPMVKARMQLSYDKTMSVTRGPGVFNRMKTAMESTTKQNVQAMFDESTITLIKDIEKLVEQLVSLISQFGSTITKHLEDVYSIFWDDKETSKLNDPEMERKIRECRNRLLPDLNKLCGEMKAARELVGIEREDLELDVMAVESLETSIQKKFDDANKKGSVFDLCESDNETVGFQFPQNKSNIFLNPVKAEMVDFSNGPTKVASNFVAHNEANPRILKERLSEELFNQSIFGTGKAADAARIKEAARTAADYTLPTNDWSVSTKKTSVAVLPYSSPKNGAGIRTRALFTKKSLASQSLPEKAASKEATAAADYVLPTNVSVPTVSTKNTSLGTSSCSLSQKAFEYNERLTLIDLCDSDDDDFFSKLKPAFPPKIKRKESILPVKKEEVSYDSDSSDGSINLLT